MQEPQILKILDTQYLTHDVKQFIVEKPKGFVYTPGQATNLSLNLPGWEKELRPFTFTSLNDWPFLEFVIKIYEDNEGMTKQLIGVNAGGEFLMHNVFGTLKYKGPGIFLAGGTGITPFIAIFRALYLTNNIRDCGLIYSNKSASDVILYEELKKMLGDNYMNVFTKEGVIGFQEKFIDRKFLIENIKDFDNRFYVCGPDDFVKNISGYLISLGAKSDYVIV